MNVEFYKSAEACVVALSMKVKHFCKRFAATCTVKNILSGIAFGLKWPENRTALIREIYKMIVTLSCRPSAAGMLINHILYMAIYGREGKKNLCSFRFQ